MHLYFIGLFHFQKAKVGWKKGGKGLMSPRSCPAWTTAIQPFPSLPVSPAWPACPALPTSPTSFYSTLNPIIMSMVWPNSKIEVQVSTFDSLGTWAAARVRRSRCAVLCAGQIPYNKVLWWASFVKQNLRSVLGASWVVTATRKRERESNSLFN